MFRLNYLQLKGHHILGTMELLFDTSSNLNEGQLFTTIVIGQNGTGKSNILKVISEIFRAFDVYKKDSSKKPDLRYQFRLKYTINGNMYEIATNLLMVIDRGKSRPSYIYLKNTPLMEITNLSDQSKIDQYAISLEQLELPTKILASSLMITDKFNAKSTKVYKYLGVRSEKSPSSTGTKTYVRKIIDNIVDGIKQKNFRSELRKLFEFLDIDPCLKLSYVPRYRHIFYREDISATDLKNAFLDDWKSFFPKRSAPIWGAESFRRFINDENNTMEQLVAFLQKASRKVFIEGNKRSLDYDIINDPDILEDYAMIDILRSLDIISYPEISISRNGQCYDLISSSSGETHLISSFIGILSQIQTNSLVLIDEPEISLHPNWQIQYIDQLKQIFHDYHSAHFVIATHSHFLLSDLTPKNSNALALDRQDGIIQCRQIDFDTYGWSPDDILYNVFNVTSSRNTFVANDIAKILDELSKGDKAVLNKLDISTYNKLQSLSESLKDNDPLKDVVKSILKKIQ
jgi:predicted ATPase